MELREWLIILGLVLVAIIVVDGVRRLQRQRKVPRLDEVADEKVDESGEALDPDEAARRAEINWELPNGGARVVRPASQEDVEPKPKLQRQEHPGPSKVFAQMNHPDAQSSRGVRDSGVTAQARREAHVDDSPSMQAGSNEDASARIRDGALPSQQGTEHGREAAASVASRESIRGHDVQVDEERSGDTSDGMSRHVERDPADAYDSLDETAEPATAKPRGMAAALRYGTQRVSRSVQRMSSALHRQDESPPAHDEHHEPTLASEDPNAHATRGSVESAGAADDAVTFPRFADQRLKPVADGGDVQQGLSTADEGHEIPRDDVVTTHPVVEKAQRHNVSAQRARETLAHAEEVIVISVMARNDEGFAGTDLLNLVLACGLRYSEMGIFLRNETEDGDSNLQFAMLDVVKPGTFELETMDDFSTPGVTFLMPLPGAQDSAAAFEAMVETAMVIVRNLGGELKDENRSVMTAQTVGFARQRVQEFERRYRLHRSQAN